MNKRDAAFRVALSVFATLFLLCSAAIAQSGNASTAGIDRAGDGPMAAVNKELEQAAIVHRVRVRTGEAVFGGTSRGTISVVALEGVEKYQAADLERGVPVHLVIVKSVGKSPIPDGSYVVKLQFKRDATSGSALFTDRTGAVVVRRPLTLRTWAQAAALIPPLYPTPQPVDLPVITSWHVLHDGRYCIDATGPGWYGKIAYY